MPHAPMRPCPRCRRPIQGKCTQCAPRVAQQRATLEPWRQLYQTPEWKALRLKVLIRDRFRCWCEECQGRFAIPRAGVVHHLEPHRGNVHLFFLESNLSSRTKRCHDRATAIEVHARTHAR